MYTRLYNSDSIKHFLSFLDKFNIIPLAFSLIISLNLNQISHSFIETIISPIINSLFVNSDVKLKDRKFIIAGIKFEYGQFLVNLIQFMFTLIILYLLYLLYVYIVNEHLDLTNISKPQVLIQPRNTQ